MQQGSDFSGGLLYPGAPPHPAGPPAAPFVPDAALSYATPTAPPHSYGSAPPFNAVSPYYTPDTASPLYAPQASSYSPQAPLPDLAPSNNTINAFPSPYSPAPNSYSTAAPSYDTSFSYQGSSVSTRDTPPYPSYGYQPEALHGIYQGSQARTYGSSQQGMQTLDRFGIPQGKGVYEHIQAKGYNKGGYARQGFEQPYYETLSEVDRGPDTGCYDFGDSGFGEAYAYEGDNTEPYGARGTSERSWTGLENPNHSLSSSSGSFIPLGESGGSKIAKAVPRADTRDVGNGVQKYRVKLLPDSSSLNGPMDVLCQIGLDGVRMVTPSTNKTVRIYPLETIKRWEVSEPSVLTFWAKSSVDVEPRKIRLQSSSYTTNTMLDTLTAACVQFSEMAIKDGPADTGTDAKKGPEQTTEKKKSSLSDWVYFKGRLPAQEEREHWVPDEAVTKCSSCGVDFGAFVRRHHCRNCGDVFCDKCTSGRTALTADEDSQPVRVCDHCLAEVTQRLSNSKETSSKPPPQRTHEDLAKKLQEEMDRNVARRSSSNNTSAKSGGEKSGQTSVLNCSACGSISLVSGNITRCPCCGTDSSSSRYVGRESGSSTGSSRLWSTQSNSDGSGKITREVACPTCTVHLQVQVPSAGTETVECGVCQHPFLVSAH